MTLIVCTQANTCTDKGGDVQGFEGAAREVREQLEERQGAGRGDERHKA